MIHWGYSSWVYWRPLALHTLQEVQLPLLGIGNGVICTWDRRIDFFLLFDRAHIQASIPRRDTFMAR